MRMTVKKEDVAKLERFGMLKSIKQSCMNKKEDGSIEFININGVEAKKIIRVITPTIEIAEEAAPVVETKAEAPVQEKKKKKEKAPVEEEKTGEETVEAPESTEEA
jgi:hypothetical protein